MPYIGQGVSHHRCCYFSSEAGIPAPPYAVFSANGTTVLSSISGLLYEEGEGPSTDSSTFSLLGDGLSPAADNITITPNAAFTSAFEIYNADTSSYTSSSFNVAYTGGAKNLSGFKVRLKAGLVDDSYTGTLTITAPNTSAFVLTVSGIVSESPFNAITLAWKSKVEAEGGSVTEEEAHAVTAFTDAIATDEFDRLWIHGLSNQIAARVSVINPNSTLITEVNSPTFTQDEGFNSDGATSYLDLNYDPTVDGDKYTQNSGSLGAYSITIMSGLGAAIGGLTTGGGTKIARIYFFITGDHLYSINSATDMTPTAVQTQGLFHAQRSTSNLTTFYKNGSVEDTSGAASVSPPALSFYELAVNFNGSAIALGTYRVSLSFIASGNLNAASFYNAVQTLGTSLGWAV